ncbi:ABC transporter permease [Cryptosporangium aurantiacum]|uniref:Transport permease protein n=1 Tax=Cryptosporangium aurantiacum TaxID=134849 RepID=A0A1M7TZ43_9ACTN|nr:ABC transporter permease [Cryptosporangium aurantiacum]SHN75989.1 ABC-2 type transport system permease protein [Cryptosporangium aurantiacum]
MILHIGLLWRRALLETLRQPVWVLTGLTAPLLYLALFAPLLDRLAGGPGFSRGSVLDVFLPGILCLMAFGAGMGAGWVVIAEAQTGVVERLRSTPASRFALVAGAMLRDVVAFLVPAALVVAVAVPFGYSPDAAGLALLLLLLALVTAATSAWSAALGLLIGDVGGLAAVVTGLQLPLTLLAGVLLPLSLAPGWLRGLAHVDPLYYAVEAARDLSAGTIGTATVAVGFAVTGALAVVTIGWATRTYRAARM